MINYDDFYESCLPKLRLLTAEKHLHGYEPVCATKYYLYFRKQDTIVETNHDGNFIMSFPVPMDLHLFINQKVIEFYEDQTTSLKRLIELEQATIADRENAFTRKWFGLFSKIIRELYGWSWNDSMWSVNIQNEGVWLKANFGARLIIPKSWFSKEEEEVAALLPLCRRIFALRQHRDVNSNFTLPKTVGDAWVELKYGQERIYNNLIPEIHYWASDDGVPHVAVPGMTVHGGKDESFNKVFYTTALLVAAGMPYRDEDYQRRMLDVLICLCKDNDEVVLDQVVGRVGPVPLRQEVEKALLAVIYRPSKA